MPSSKLLLNELQYEITITALPRFSISPTCDRHKLLHCLSPYLQNISPTIEQHAFYSVLYGEDPVSDLSLHVLQAPRSALWVVGCGSLITSIPPHVHGLRARCYGLWASQGQESSKETARMLLMLRISLRFFATAEQHVPLYVLWRRPSLRSLLTRATGSALCVMGGQLRFLGHAYSYTCTGFALDVMDYGLAKAKSPVKS